MTRYQVLSPDGFTIECDPFYQTKREALQALNDFIERFEPQGYYSNSNRERIDLADLPAECQLITVNN